MIALLVVYTPVTLVFLLLLPIAFFDLPINFHFDIVDELGRVHSSPIAVVLWLDDIGLDPFLNTIDCRYPSCLLFSKRFDASPDVFKCNFSGLLISIRLALNFWT